LIVAYIVLIAFTLLLWNAPMVFLAVFLSIAMILGEEGAVGFMNFMAACSVLATIALPLKLIQNKIAARMVTALLGVAIMIGYPVLRNIPVQLKATEAVKGDIEGGPFHNEKNIAYHSSFSREKCGNICLKFLFSGKADTFTAYRRLTNRDWYRKGATVKTRSPAKIGSGRTYKLEKGSQCTIPAERGADGVQIHSTLREAYALVGTCVIGTPVSADAHHDLHIVFERNPKSEAIQGHKQFKSLYRLWVLRNTGTDQVSFAQDAILSRQTKLKYEKLAIPFLAPVYRELRLGNWAEGETSVNELNSDTAPLALLSEFFPNDQARPAEWQLPQPADSDVLEAATKQLMNFEKHQPRSSQVQQRWHKNLQRIYKDGKIRDGSDAEIFKKFADAAMLTATRQVERQADSPETPVLDQALLKVVSEVSYDWQLYKPEYSFRKGFDRTQKPVQRFEAAMMDAAARLGVHVKASGNDTPKAFIPLFRFAVKLAAGHENPDAAAVNGIWAAALRTNEKFIMWQMFERHGELLPTAVTDLLKRLNAEPVEKKYMVHRWSWLLKFAPVEQLRTNASSVNLALKKYQLSISPSIIKDLRRSLGEQG